MNPVAATNTADTTLAEALARVMAEVGYIATPPGPALDAPDADAVVRQAMTRQGVVVLPKVIEILACEPVTAGRRRTGTRVVVRATFRFVHGASGEELDVQAIGEGRDDGDGAAAKALAGAMRTALRQSFGLDPADARAGQPTWAPGTGSPASAVARGRYAQEFGRCTTRAEYLDVCQRIAEDAKVGVLTEADRDALKDVARDTSARLPVRPARLVRDG